MDKHGKKNGYIRFISILVSVMLVITAFIPTGAAFAEGSADAIELSAKVDVVKNAPDETEVLSDVKTTVKVSAPAGGLPEGAELTADLVYDESYIKAVEIEIEKQGRALTDAIAIDLTLTKDGEAIQPAGPVTVTIGDADIDADTEEGIKVFYVADDSKKATEMETTVAKADKQEFSVDHFSVYVAAGSAEEEKTEAVESGDEGSEDETEGEEETPAEAD